MSDTRSYRPLNDQEGEERRTQLDEVSDGTHDDETDAYRLGDFDEFTFVRFGYQSVIISRQTDQEEDDGRKEGTTSVLV